MELNLDCARDVMKYVEENAVMRSDGAGGVEFAWINWDKIAEDLETYGFDNVKYTVFKLYEAGYLCCDFRPRLDKTGGIPKGICNVIDITKDGHDFINSVRDATVWNETKEKCKAAGLMTLKALVTTAGVIARARLAAGLGIDPSIF